MSPVPTPVKKLKFVCESPKATKRTLDDCLFDQAPVKECTYLQNPKLFSNRERMCSFNPEAQAVDLHRDSTQISSFW